MRTGHETRLAVLPMVLRGGLPVSDQSFLFRQILYGALRQSEMHAQTTHPLYEILPLVPDQGAASLENSGRRAGLPALPLGRLDRVLGDLPLVRSEFKISPCHSIQSERIEVFFKEIKQAFCAITMAISWGFRAKQDKR